MRRFPCFKSSEQRGGNDDEDEDEDDSYEDGHEANTKTARFSLRKQEKRSESKSVGETENRKRKNAGRQIKEKRAPTRA